MRLKKSGVPQFEDEFEEDLGDVLSENKREAEEPAPVMISTPEEYDYWDGVHKMWALAKK